MVTYENKRMRYESEPVVERYKFFWKNGRTDLVITKTRRGYHAFDHCFERISNNGTAVDDYSVNLYKVRTLGLMIMRITTGTKEVE